jgi:hypothetical protein
MNQRRARGTPIVTPIHWAKMPESTQIYLARSSETILSRQSK